MDGFFQSVTEASSRKKENPSSSNPTGVEPMNLPNI